MKIERLVETLNKEYDKIKIPTLKDYINRGVKNIYVILDALDELVYYSTSYEKIVGIMRESFKKMKTEHFVDSFIYMSAKKACKILKF